MDTAPPPPEAGRAPEAAAKKYSFGDYLFQFITITAGVLIALLVNGLVEVNTNRSLVRDARATIARELADNKKDLDATLAAYPDDLRRLDSAIKFANDRLTTRKTTVNQLNFNVNLADLSSTGWRTAERTGALGHMDYAEVQRLSKLYDFQDLFVEQQRNMVGHLSSATAILSKDFDPDNPNPKDLEVFRERVMLLRAALAIQETMGKRLAVNYGEALRP